MENQESNLTVNQVIEQLQGLSPELKNERVVFSYPDGESLGVVAIENITILKSMDQDGNELTAVSIGGTIEDQVECDCDECVAERAMQGDEDDIDGIELANKVQGIFVQALWEAGLENWAGLKYAQGIYQDKLKDAGLINGNFGE